VLVNVPRVPLYLRCNRIDRCGPITTDQMLKHLLISGECSVIHTVTTFITIVLSNLIQGRHESANSDAEWVAGTRQVKL